MGVHSVSLVVKQQHDGVEFPARPIVGTQRHDEVVEPVARRLGRDNNQLVLEPIGLGIFIAVVFAALGMWGEPKLGTTLAVGEAGGPTSAGTCNVGAHGSPG